MSDRLLVYQLYEGDALDARAETLAQHLATPGPGRPIEPTFTAMPGGCFRYFDRGRLEHGDTPDLLPKDEDAARRAAIDYMRAVNQAAARHRTARGLDAAQHPDPFPVRALHRGATRRVRSHRTGRDDHWLTTWGVWLPAAQARHAVPVPVVGATVEVRVGARGQVVGVVSRARPWKSTLIRPAYTWKAGHGHDHGHEHEGGTPPLVYVSDNPDEPLRFWSPCYLVPPADEKHSHAERRLWPACDHTLLPEILVLQENGEATAFAMMPMANNEVVAVEHGQQWRLTWSVASLAEFIAGERRTFVATSAALPGTGLYQIEVLVENVVTGAIRSTHVQSSVLGRV